MMYRALAPAYIREGFRVWDEEGSLRGLPATIMPLECDFTLKRKLMDVTLEENLSRLEMDPDSA